MQTKTTPSAARQGALRVRPYRDLSPVGEVGELLESMFDGFLPRPAARLSSLLNPREDGFAPRIEVRTTESGLEVTAEVPGVAPDAIELSIDDDVLVLSGEKQSEESREEQGVLHTERSYGSFRRMVQLPFPVDAAESKARFEHGLLRVELPKAAELETAKRIPIEGA